MSKAFKDPSLLTKDRLKKELESNGVKLPRGEQKKEYYVNLYRENLSPQSGGRRLGNGEFSSDDDDYESPQSKQIVPRASHVVRKIGSKDIVSSDIKSMSDEELKDELSSLGHPVGPIMPSTRDLYERKLARLRTSTPNNSSTTIEKSEFSDFSEEEQQDEESIPDDEFFYKRQGRNQKSGGTFGSTFSKNFQNSSSKKEVSQDFSVSSSRNVERSSTVDRKTMNKVRTKKGDKFEEKSWSSSPANDNDKNDEDDAVQLPSGLPASVQKALTSARRYTLDKENGTELRARPSREQPEEVPESISPATVEEKPKKKASRKWWRLIIFVLILLLIAAVVYNLERLPAIKQQFRSLQGQSKPNSSI